MISRAIIKLFYCIIKYQISKTPLVPRCNFFLETFMYLYYAKKFKKINLIIINEPYKKITSPLEDMQSFLIEKGKIVNSLLQFTIN